MISGQFHGRGVKLILAVSVALSAGTNSYAAVSFQCLPLNLVAAPTAVENVSDSLSGISEIGQTSKGTPAQCDGSVRPAAAGELVPAVQTGDGSLKPSAAGELVPAVQTGDSHSTGGGGGAGKGTESSQDFHKGGGDAASLNFARGGDAAHSTGGGGGAGKGTDASAVDMFRNAGSDAASLNFTRGGDAAHGSGGGGGAGKGTEASAVDMFRNAGGDAASLNFTKSGDAAHGSGGAGKGPDASAVDMFRNAGSDAASLNFTRGGDAAHGSGGGGGAGKGTEASAVDMFRNAGGDAASLNFARGAASDIPLDQGGVESSRGGALPQLSPTMADPPGGSIAGIGKGQAIPTIMQGHAELDLPFSGGAGKQGFANEALAGRGSQLYQTGGSGNQTYQTGGSGKGQGVAGLNFTTGAASFAAQQGALNGVGARAGSMAPFNPGALGNFTATPSIGGSAGAASALGALQGGGGGGAVRVAPAGITIGGSAGAHASGRTFAPSLMPGALIMPQH